METAHVINDPERQAALQRLALLDSPTEEAFDRLTRLAAKILRAPVALVSLVDHDRQFFKSCVGLPEPWASQRQTPLSHSFCQYVVATHEPLIVSDARIHPLLHANLAIPDLNVIAYAGIPLITSDGHTLGSFCVIDSQPRVWQPDEIEILQDLAGAVMTEISLRAEIIERQALADALRESEIRFRSVVESATDAIILADDEGVLVGWNASAATIFGYSEAEVLGQPLMMLMPDHVRWSHQQALVRLSATEPTRLLGKTLELTGCHKNGTIFPLELSLATWLQGERRWYSGIIRDITERTHVEAALQQKTGFVQLLQHVAVAANEATTIQQAVQAAIKHICQHMGWAIGHAYVTDACQTTASAMMLWHGADDEPLSALRLRLEQLWRASEDELSVHKLNANLPAWAISTTAERTTNTAQIAHDFGIKAIVTFPILIRTEIVGVLEFFTTTIVAPETSFLDIMTSIGTQLGCVVERQRAVAAFHASETALRESETRFRTVVESLGEGLMVTDKDDTIRYVNTRMTMLSGYSEAELLGHRACELFLPESAWSVIHEHNARRFQHIAEQYEIQIVRKDSSLIWLGINASPLLNATGEIVGTLGAHTDISERKQAEAALRASEERFRQIAEHISAAFWITSPDAKQILYISPAYETIWGRPCAEVLQNSEVWFTAVHPDDQERVMAAQFKKSLGTYDEEYRIVRPNGDVRWVWSRAFVIHDDQGHIYRLVGVSEDITQRKEVEAALSVEREFLRAVLENIVEGIVACNEQGILTFFNRAAYEFHTLPQEQLSPEHWAAHYDLYRPDGHTLMSTDEVPLMQAFNGAYIRNIEMIIAPRQGVARTLLTSGQPIFDANGNKRGAVVTMFDITERKRSDEEREGLIQQLQAVLARTEALYHNASALIAIESLTELLQMVVNSTAAALMADRMTLITLDLARRQIEHFVSGGPSTAVVVNVDFDELWDGLTGWVLRTMQPVLSPSQPPDPRESVEVQQRRIKTECGTIMVVPLFYRGTVLGTITAIRSLEEPDFSSNDLELLVAMANQAAIAITNAKLFSEVQHLAITDGLTQVYNRRGFFEVGRHTLDRVHRQGSSLSALLFDVDHFKYINDTYGHATGDQVLQTLAKRCLKQVRKMDLLGRYGGEEFGVLLPDTDLQTAKDVAERIRIAVASEPIQTTTASVMVTISIGVARLDQGIVDLEELLHNADQALYQAKSAGRNRVVIAS